MGCDIHIQIERKTDEGWKRVVWTNEWRRKCPDIYSGSTDPNALELGDNFDGRNYDLFGIFADVRNGTCGDAVPPIAEPRGRPEDADWGDWLGDHSFSWLSLRELQDYDWDAPLIKRGWVNHEQAEKFRADGIPPDSYSAWSSRGEVVQWTTTRREAVGDWPGEFLPILATLGEPNNVRLVFGFDS